ncbi:PLDc N-terminal domain-containing protein [Sphingomonas sp. Leaf339]|uniref:PLDc N-terminal domain-containing protein n=1 Tax=Sphingomonas sp. Leaf339 TaxID=1736343 RepID=UPI000A3DE5B1|nr:PLDc N-terminal domain-containing protein [Sphingomonas sp. Leaf339]
MLADHPDVQTIWFVAEWLIRLGALTVVPLRRSPAAAASWLLLLFIFPVGGLLLYLIIGRPGFPAARERRWRTLRPFFADVGAMLTREAGGDGGATAAFAHTLGRLPCVGGNDIELIDDYDAVIDRLVADIDGARSQVDLLVYIFADDAVGQRVAAALARATARGVRCRVVFDPVGSHKWRRGTLRLLRDTGTAVREALPAHLLRRHAAPTCATIASCS